MNEATLLLFLMNFALIGALPFVFFKHGRFNLLWCLTSAPYVICAAVLVISYLSGQQDRWSAVSGIAAVPFSVLSIGLISLTLGTHRVALALWHQKDDAPQQIVTSGPYRRIRHPFYAAFLTALFGAVVLSPSAGTLLSFTYALFMLNFTAAREEKRLANSEFGSDYRRYMQQTGRFLPKFHSSTLEEI
jgi:protein-S-isoprenylcysteine O-methyltransferase Ste14